VPAQLYFIHPDHLGTPRAITKSTDNTKVWEWKNDDPFGNNAPDENPNGANGPTQFKYNLRFPGQYFDEETNTHYNYFRDYDPSTGRYVQSDPIGLGGGLSTYLYANANSLTFIDPSGESAVVVAGACVVVGTTIYFVWKFGKFKKCVEQCVKCPNNPDRDPNVQCQPLKDDGKTNPNASCKTYCTLDAFGGPRGKGPAGSRDYP
jgi:RHS repeat-associated protein